MTGMGAQGEKHEGFIVAVNDAENNYDYPEEVAYVIRQNQQEDYIEAAQFINSSNADICILEHEFGIFGGDNGIYILSLLHRLEIPFIVVFHTILKTPSCNEKIILNKISSMAAKSVVMVQKAVDLLTTGYDIPVHHINVIAHGVPDLQFDHQLVKSELGLEGKKVLLTFGLISRNKGIETAIRALPAVIEKHPEAVYVVLGKTHPTVLKHSGEEYRNYLVEMTRELQLEDHVQFVDEFVDEEKLVKYLTAADIYVTPYLNEGQITSGTLSYAFGAGCVVVSTPYWHAAELSAQGHGRLFKFNDSDSLSEALLELLDNPSLIHSLQEKARAYGRQITWKQIGKKYIKLAEQILKVHSAGLMKSYSNESLVLPPFSLDHIERMTDNTGIIQHAKFSIPNWREGYCLDDNARALLMTLMAYNQRKLPEARELMRVYLGYIHYMQRQDGSFRNFLGFDRQFPEISDSEDAFGRTIWALGYLIYYPPSDPYHQLGKEIFQNAVPWFRKIRSPRGMANTIIGMSYYLRKNPIDAGMAGLLKEMADQLVELYIINSSRKWKWFENVLTYDNAIMPIALMHAFQVLRDDQYLRVALGSLDFLSKITLSKGYLSLVGNKEWYAENGTLFQYAQQPIDAMGMVLAFEKAYRLTQDESYYEKMQTSFKWFLGENELHLGLFDPETKGCYDGLEQGGVNRNQGAESTLAYWIAYLAMARMLRVKDSRKEQEMRINGSTYPSIIGTYDQ